MKNFKVYHHPIKGFEAVKIGFSWPVCLLGIPWMLAKKLWAMAGIWFLMYLCAGIVSVIADHSGLTPGLQIIVSSLLFVAYIALCLIPGFKGNSWRLKNLEKRGYEFKREIQADSPDAAIALAVKGETA